MEMDCWKKSFDRALVARYGIDTVDAGLDDDDLDAYSELDPQDAAESYGKKYALTPSADGPYGLSRDKRCACAAGARRSA